MKKNTLKFLLWMGALSSVTVYNSYASQPTTTEVAIERAKHSMQDIKESAVDKKDAATAKAKEVISYMDSRIRDLEYSIADKKNGMTDAARDTKTKALVKLKQERAEINNWYNKFKDSTEDTWDKTKEGFSRAYDAFQDAFKNS